MNIHGHNFVSVLMNVHDVTAFTTTVLQYQDVSKYPDTYEYTITFLNRFDYVLDEIDIYNGYEQNQHAAWWVDINAPTFAMLEEAAAVTIHDAFWTAQECKHTDPYRHKLNLEIMRDAQHVQYILGDIRNGWQHMSKYRFTYFDKALLFSNEPHPWTV